MLKFYFATVIIYFVIFSACVKLFGKAIRENGWLGGEEKGQVSIALVNRFLVAVIPVLRLLLVVGFIVMAATKKEDFK